MITHESVQTWLDRYVAAWKSLDPDQIRALFTEDVEYSYTPFDEPLVGREEIVRAWLEDFDDPSGSYDAKYYPIAIEGNVAVTNGRTRYYEPDGRTLEAVFDNIFVLTFDEVGQCVIFREWYVTPHG